MTFFLGLPSGNARRRRLIRGPIFCSRVHGCFAIFLAIIIKWPPPPPSKWRAVLISYYRTLKTAQFGRFVGRWKSESTWTTITRFRFRKVNDLIVARTIATLPPTHPVGVLRLKSATSSQREAVTRANCSRCNAARLETVGRVRALSILPLAASLSVPYRRKGLKGDGGRQAADVNGDVMASWLPVSL